MSDLSGSPLRMCLALAFFMWLACGSVLAKGPTNSIKEIETLVRQINREVCETRRAELAQKLANPVRIAPDRDRATDAAIDHIAGLLRDRDDVVRYYAEAALGQFGPRAARAVPELERVLRDAEARDGLLAPEISSADGIRAALTKITGRPWEPHFIGETNSIKDIETIVGQINGEASEATRANLADKLAKTIWMAPDRDQATEAAIDDVAGLLRDRNDGVRYWAALALGQFGSRAARAVPALEQALKEAEARADLSLVEPELSSADGISDALARITDRPWQPRH